MHLLLITLNQSERHFQVNDKDSRIIAEREANLKRRLDREVKAGQGEKPMLGDLNIHYEMGAKVRAIACGGIGAFHKLVTKVGLDKAMNDALNLLKTHMPYHESDHVLNIAYNVLTGGTCLEDIERLREDENFLDALGTERIPDPTTAGDFLRRFECEETLLALQEAVNGKRQALWRKQEAAFRKQGILDVDGTLAETLGECKEGMDISHKGIWGYHPLIVTLANTREPLYLVNRPGNEKSSQGAGPWIDRAIACVGEVFEEVVVRGDTDFSLTRYFDGWDERATFIFGYKAYENLFERAENLPKSAWKRLRRPPKYTVKTRERERPDNVKERIVRERGYENVRLVCEHVAQFEYRPTTCKKTYRMVAVRKNLSVEKGERRLFDEILYFFYITNDWDSSPEEIVFSANERCDQENVIAQLKSGIHALRMPTGDLCSNWAYMVIASLAWTLKAWYALLMPERKQRRRAIRMEFKSFARWFVHIPCQIVRTGGRSVYRILAYNRKLETFFRTYERIRAFALP
jgi:hypothetical protein